MSHNFHILSLSPSKLKDYYENHEDLMYHTMDFLVDKYAFKTNYLFDLRYLDNYDGKFNIIVGLYGKITFGRQDYYILTTEGIICCKVTSKKKFLIYQCDPEAVFAFATYEELAEEGYTLDKYYHITLSSNSRFSTNTTDKIKIESMAFWDLEKILPKLVNLYKSNRGLYEDAIDDILDKYPN